MLRRFWPLWLAILPLLAAPPAGDPARARMDPAAIQKITPRLQEFVSQGVLAGAVGLVARNGEVAYHDAVGYQDLEAKKPMTTGTIFQIMSMTKPFAAVGILMLVEDGKLNLNDPVERYLPEFRAQMVIDQTHPDGKVTLRRPARPVLIRDLMTHTSGMGEPDDSLDGLYEKMHLTLEKATALFARMPLKFDPGTRWMYSSPGIGALGRVLEVVSGLPFETFLEQRIFTPLGMKDSFIFPTPDRIPRIAMVYRPEGGKLVRATGGILGGDPAQYRKGAKFSAPEWGLYSTAADLFAFYQCMLNGGEYRGRRLLTRQSVDLMTAVHTGHLEPAGHTAGWAYGLAWTVLRDETGMLNLQSKGTFGHGGAFGTNAWADPVKKIVGVFLIQRSGGGSFESRNFISLAQAAALD